MSTFVLRPKGPINVHGTLRVFGPPLSRSHLAAATALAKGLHALEEAACAVPLAFLAAQVVETALKAYLVTKVKDRKLHAKSIGHNIPVLWGMAHRLGLAISATPPRSIALIARLHNRPFPLRYGQKRVTFISTGVGKELVRDAQSLLRTVAAAL